MLNKYKASILITNYNNEKYIKKCVSSCLSQSFKNLEVILFDDVSTDNSLNVIKKIKDNRLIVIKNNKKKSKFSTINQIYAFKRAFKKSSGDFIFLLDGDDFFLSKKIQIIINKYIKNEWKFFIQDTPVFWYQKINKKIIKEKKIKNIKSSLWPYFYPTSTMCFKRSYFNECLKNLEFSFKNFSRVFLDARISIYTFYIKKELLVDDNNLTIYRQNDKGDTHINKYNSIIFGNWWKRRLDYHYFMKRFCLKFKFQHIKGIDFFITKLINYII